MSPEGGGWAGDPGDADACGASPGVGGAVDVSCGDVAWRHATAIATFIVRRAATPYVRLSRCMTPDYTKPAAAGGPGWTLFDFMRESE